MERLTDHGQHLAPHEAQTDARAPQRLWVISPCFNRPEDAQNLCQALATLKLPPNPAPTLVLVDNASTPSMAESLGASPIPGPWRCHHLRQPTNIGGSGGYNAGLAYAVAHADPDDPDDPVWLLDSDALPEPDALLALLETLSIPGVAAAGSLLKDPDTGEYYELGGRVNARTGEYASAWNPDSGSPPTQPIDAEYLAACSLLTTARAIRQTGLMPDTFLNGDDVAWGYRLARATGGRLPRHTELGGRPPPMGPHAHHRAVLRRPQLDVGPAPGRRGRLPSRHPRGRTRRHPARHRLATR